MYATLPALKKAKEFTEQRFQDMRVVAEQGASNQWTVATVGSYGRKEAGPASDCDFYLIYAGDSSQDAANEYIRKAGPGLSEIAGKEPAKGGAFDAIEDLETFLQNIGGQEDTNQKITRRMLLLLEGASVWNDELFREVRQQVISKYVRPSISSHQLALFLLNDIIRYYRTMCVDFDHKTVQNDKPWGTRNIKLVFSRKLIYFSGIVAVAQTYQRTYDRKIKVLRDLLDLTPVDRVLHVCGEPALRALRLYDNFVAQLSDPIVRQQLDTTTEDGRDDVAVFRELKDEGHHFTLELDTLLKGTFNSGHPIHRALVL